MCHKQIMTPLPIKFAKITVIVIFFCFAECAAGSCLKYGHACWGAHGKRSSQTVPQWFISKLLANPDINRFDYDLPVNEQLFPQAQIEAETFKGQDFNEAIFDKLSKLINKRSTKIDV